LRFELFVALRYLLAQRRQAFISLISLISTIGVAVGVMALVIALALMTGMQGELRDRILGSTAHIYVWRTGGIKDYRADVQKLLQVPGVVGAAPAILGKALATSSHDSTFISLKGVDPALEPNVTDIRRSMIQGSIDSLTPRGDERPGVLIGKDLASMLGVKVGDTINLLTPNATLTPMGLMFRPFTVRVSGIYSLGLYEFDSSYGFITLDLAKRLLDKTGPDLVQLKVRDIYAAPEIAETIPPRMGKDYVAQDWSDMQKQLFSALWMEKMGISIAIGLIVAVAALNIVASLILLVMEKSRDIAILKTMGTSAQRIMTIFMLQGLVIGCVGTVIGGAAGYAICWVLDRYKVIHLSADVYQISYVPFTVLPLDFAIVIVSAIVISFVATLYPSRQAARLDPVQALRFE
jgi:lipoprotein-releasing system permease protein